MAYQGAQLPRKLLPRMVQEIPQKCPDCDSENMDGNITLIQDAEDMVLCNACGLWIVLESGQSNKVSAAQSGTFCMRCPHCLAIDQIHEYSGTEICYGCGLDPATETYTTKDLAHLWKPGSGLKAMMDKGNVKHPSTIFEFLITKCGPHCPREEVCGQSTATFAACRNGNTRTHQNRRHVGVGISIDKGTPKALLRFAKNGWYEKLVEYKNENGNSPGSKHTGSGSGT